MRYAAQVSFSSPAAFHPLHPPPLFINPPKKFPHLSTASPVCARGHREIIPTSVSFVVSFVISCIVVVVVAGIGRCRRRCPTRFLKPLQRCLWQNHCLWLLDLPVLLRTPTPISPPTHSSTTTPAALHTAARCRPRLPSQQNQRVDANKSTFEA